jgi:hypothetical protein
MTCEDQHIASGRYLYELSVDSAKPSFADIYKRSLAAEFHDPRGEPETQVRAIPLTLVI